MSHILKLDSITAQEPILPHPKLTQCSHRSMDHPGLEDPFCAWHNSFLSLTHCRLWVITFFPQAFSVLATASIAISIHRNRPLLNLSTMIVSICTTIISFVGYFFYLSLPSQQFQPLSCLRCFSEHLYKS